MVYYCFTHITIYSNRLHGTWLLDFLATKLPRRSWVLLRRPRFRSPPGPGQWRKWAGTNQFWRRKIMEKLWKTGGTYENVKKLNDVKLPLFNLATESFGLRLAKFDLAPMIAWLWAFAAGTALFHLSGEVTPHGVEGGHLAIPLHIQQKLLGVRLPGSTGELKRQTWEQKRHFDHQKKEKILVLTNGNWDLAITKVDLTWFNHQKLGLDHSGIQHTNLSGSRMDLYIYIHLFI